MDDDLVVECDEGNVEQVASSLEKAMEDGMGEALARPDG